MGIILCLIKTLIDILNMQIGAEKCRKINFRKIRFRPTFDVIYEYLSSIKMQKKNFFFAICFGFKDKIATLHGLFFEFIYIHC